MWDLVYDAQVFHHDYTKKFRLPFVIHDDEATHQTTLGPSSYFVNNFSHPPKVSKHVLQTNPFYFHLSYLIYTIVYFCSVGR